MKITKLSGLLAAILFTTILFSSCKDDEVPPTPTENPFESLTLVAEQYTGVGSLVKIYSDEALFVGYNNIYIALFDSASNEQISDGHIDIMPMMDMGMMKHSAPYENAGHHLDANTKAFKGAVVFIMPSNMGTWTLDLHVHNHIAKNEVEVSIPVTVVAKSEGRVKSFMSKKDSTPIFVTLINPTSPEVGLNDISFGVYKRKTMMDFPAIDNASIEFDPQMLSMGHGSPNNVNPSFKDKGIYEGKINYTMTGKWTIFTVLKDSSQDVMGDTIAFETTLK